MRFFFSFLFFFFTAISARCEVRVIIGLPSKFKTRLAGKVVGLRAPL